LTPLGKVDRARRTWFLRVISYTVAGAISSTGVGAVLGGVGYVVLHNVSRSASIAIPIVASALTITMALSGGRFPVPQLRRQTKRSWGMKSSATSAVVLWGLDLGLVFSTRITLPAVWMLIADAFVCRAPAIGGMLVAAYWFGRVLPVWFGPLVLTSPTSTSSLIAAVWAERRIVQAVGVVSLFVLCASSL